jgi:hypothetical protein
MIQCPQCKTKNPNTSSKCESCGTSLKSAQPSKGAAMNAVVNQLFDKLDTLNERISEIEQNTGKSSGVTVSDIKMPFGSMVVLMVKWAIASIPAMIILFIIGSIVTGIFGGLFGAMFR